MNIRSLQGRLDRIEASTPRAVVHLWEPTKAEERKAIRQKAKELGISERNVLVHTYHWLDSGERAAR